MERTFCISDDLFGGFKTSLNLQFITNLGEIVNEVKFALIYKLKELQLEYLQKKLENISFHIHTYTIDEILNSDPSCVFYICSHVD